MKIEHFKYFKEIYFVFSWEVAIFSYVAHFQDNVFGFEFILGLFLSVYLLARSGSTNESGITCDFLHRKYRK